MIHHHQARTFCGDVLDPGRLHSPPHRVEELEERLQGLGEAPVGAELVHVLGMPRKVERALGRVPHEARLDGERRPEDGEERREVQRGGEPAHQVDEEDEIEDHLEDEYHPDRHR